MTVNLESSVSAVETITPSALTWMLTTPSMPISERVYNICVFILVPSLISLIRSSLLMSFLYLKHTLISPSVPVRCLAFVMKTHSVNYRKVRPLGVLCNMDLCRQAIRYGCQREDSCYYAHSVIELKTWRVQRDTGAVYQTLDTANNRIIKY